MNMFSGTPCVVLYTVLQCTLYCREHYTAVYTVLQLYIIRNTENIVHGTMQWD